jgi:D-3-phosphoglycerate dehydrogenase
MKILLTSTSFQDTPGAHQDLLHSQGFEVDTVRGPIPEEELLPIIADYDAVICGDDEYTSTVIQKGKTGQLKYICKYGVGLDKIDLDAAKEYGIPVTNCPGVNQVSVAEHVFAMLLCFSRNVHLEHNITQAGGWFRHVGNEIHGKTLAIFGLGSVGKEVAKRGKCFGLKVKVFDKFLDKDFVKQYDLEVCHTVEELIQDSDIISMHAPLTPETKHTISKKRIEQYAKKGLIIINTARALLVEFAALESGLVDGTIGGYLTDVLEIEPMIENHPLTKLPNVIITPHIGSRTYQSVARQGSMAVQNLLDLIAKE